MELYCIKTHSKKAVIEGNIYPLISDKCPCKCDCIDVGIKSRFISTKGDSFFLGEMVACQVCLALHPADGIWWISKSLFANIDSISISEVTEQLNQKELVEII